MSERYDATEIAKMSRMILKTANEIEKNLEDIVKNLAIYRSCLNDPISAEAEALVRNIRDRIDDIRNNFDDRSQLADSAAKDIDILENGGLGV